MKKKNESSYIEGRNPVIEAFRSGKTVDKLYVLEGCRDAAVLSILKEAKKQNTVICKVSKDRLNSMSLTKAHQGVIALMAAYKYAEFEDVFENAKLKGEDPFLILLDQVEDPHNLGAVIRTANLAGAHGVIITKRRSALLNATVVKASAGAVNYIPVVKVSNLGAIIDELKERGIWLVCADMVGTTMYDLDLTGPIALVLGNEGIGVSRLIQEKCDFKAAIPMKGDIDSLNVSVAAGVISYEIVRQRLEKSKYSLSK